VPPLFFDIGDALCFDDVDASAGELNHAIACGENGVVPAHADIKAGEKFCAALTQNDIAGNYHLTARDLEAQKLWVAVATVSCRTLSFFMSHSKTSTVFAINPAINYGAKYPPPQGWGLNLVLFKSYIN